MGFNWQGIIVRATDLDSIRELEPRAIALPGGFVRVAWDNFDWTEVGSTVSWSTKFGEAWMLCAASTSGVFAYEHGRDGEILRSLAFDGSDGWLTVQGEPEPWERFDGPPIEGELEPFADSDLVLAIAERIGTQLVR